MRERERERERAVNDGLRQIMKTEKKLNEREEQRDGAPRFVNASNGQKSVCS
jgi:hypothetical protein